MFHLSPRAIVAASIITMLGFVPATAQAQNPADSTAPQAVQSNPWDKYSPSFTNVPSPVKASEKSSEPASGYTVNPWDKYAPAENKQSAPKGNAAPQNSGSNPWDKYTTDKVPMVPFAPNTPSQENSEVNGANPWDKYTPAAMPKVTPKHREHKAEKALELAEPLKERPLPTEENQVEMNLPIGTDYYFAIEHNGQLIGFSEFVISNVMILDGRATYLLSSSSRVKVGTDKVQDLRYYSKLQLAKRDLTPSSLICNQKSAKDAYKITCIYSPGLIAQSNTFNEQRNNYIHELQKPTSNLIFNNLWGQLDTFAEHYWLLVLSAFKGGVVDVYDPILRTDGKVIVYAPIKETWDDNNKKLTTLVYTISDLHGSPLARVRLNAKTKELLEIREIGNGLTFRRSNAGVRKQVDLASGLNLWPSKVRISNIYFADPNKLTHLEADVEMSMRGGQLAQHAITGYEQKTYGEVSEGKLSGRVVVDTKPADVKQTALFPFRTEVPEEYQKYLEFNAKAEAQDALILNKAQEVTWRAETAYLAARRLTGFIANKIENGISLPSSLQTLEHGIGNPESKALLLVDMCRALKIPARCVGGLVYHRGEFAPHYWAEIWLGPDDQWMAFDPTTNESGFINASHIALWESGDVHSLQIEVEKFAPHPTRRVPFFNRKLQWPVGEKRTYAIHSQGRCIGTEIAHLRDLELVDDKESYNFHAESRLGDIPEEAVAPHNVDVEQSESATETSATAENAPDGANADAASNDKVADASKATTESGSAEAQDNSSAAAKTDSAQADKAEAPAATGKANAEPAAAKEQGSLEAPPPQNALPSENSSTLQQDMTKATEAGSQAQDEAKEKAEDQETQAKAEDEKKTKGEAKNQAEAQPEAPSQPLQIVTSDSLFNSVGLPLKSVVTTSDEAHRHVTTLTFANNKVHEIIEANGETIERDIPVSNGLYLADQRTLSQWALAIEQIPFDEEQEGQEAGYYSLHIFIPELLDSQELLLAEDEETTTILMPDGQEVETTCYKSEKGMEFYVDDKHHVVKIAIPNRELEFYLLKTEFSLE